MVIHKDFRNTEENLNAYQKHRARTIYETAKAFGDPDPVGAVAQAYRESMFDPNAGSSAGAKGEWQFIDGTAKRFGANQRDPDSSLRAALNYRKHIRNYNAKRHNLYGEEAMWAGYNAGEGRTPVAMQKFSETRTYIQKIRESRSKFAKLLGVDPNYGSEAVPAPLGDAQLDSDYRIQRPAPVPVTPTVEAPPPRVEDSPIKMDFSQGASPSKSFVDSLYKRLLGY